MKQGKRPTRGQKATLAACGLNPADWLMVKNQNHCILVVHRKTKETKLLKI